jgi:hypothetical protein
MCLFFLDKDEHISEGMTQKISEVGAVTNRSL